MELRLIFSQHISTYSNSIILSFYLSFYQFIIYLPTYLSFYLSHLMDFDFRRLIL